jgi:hypothetical protein
VHGYEVRLNQKHNEKFLYFFDIINAEELQINSRRPSLKNLIWAFTDDIPESAVGGMWERNGLIASRSCGFLWKTEAWARFVWVCSSVAIPTG